MHQNYWFLVQGANRAHAYADRMLTHLNVRSGVRLHIQKAIPEHAGLGSGTQLALAVGVAICRLFENELTLPTIARILGRGNRSGIGIGAFADGGFIVDGGRRAMTEVPPVISRHHFPDAWRFLLVLDKNHQGVHGTRERQAFNQLQKMPEEDAARLCRLVLMQALPSLVEQDCASFGSAITQIQVAMGEYFATAQQGIFASARVGDFLEQLRKNGADAIGQSSWGPTGFALFASETTAYQAQKNIQRKISEKSGIELLICRAQNLPATVTLIKEEIKTDNHLLNRVSY